MPEQKGQFTQWTLKDLEDQTLFRINSDINLLFELISETSDLGKINIQEIRRQRGVLGGVLQQVTSTSADLTPPGNVSGITLEFQYFTDFSKQNTEDLIELEIRGNYTPPFPVGTFKGVHVYVEYPDGSAAPDFTLDGNSALDGTEGLSGGFQPFDGGRYPHRVGDPFLFRVRLSIPPPKASTNVRVYLASYSDEIENQLIRATETNATPSATIAITAPQFGPSGEEYAKRVTNFQIDTFTRYRGAVLERVIKTTWDKPTDDPGFTGVWLYLQFEGETDPYLHPLGSFTSSPTESWFEEPRTVQVVTLWAPSFSDPLGTEDATDDGINSIVSGLTPFATFGIGAGQTLDLGQALLSSISAAMAVVNEVLGVATGGITESLIATFAVSQQKLANAQIIDAARIVDAAVLEAKLATDSVTTPKIAALAVTTAKIDNLAVTNAKIDNLAVTGAKIANLAVGTAQIADAAISTAKIQNLAVTNALIANAAITDAKISDLSVAKLTAGTIAVAVTMTAPTLQITSGGTVINIDATSFIKITNTGLASFTSINSLQFKVESTTSSSIVASLRVLSGQGELFVGSVAASSTHQPDKITFNGTQVLRARMTGWSAPSGTTSRATFNTATVTVSELAERVKALLEDLGLSGGHGLIGA